MVLQHRESAEGSGVAPVIAERQTRTRDSIARVVQSGAKLAADGTIILGKAAGTIAGGVVRATASGVYHGVKTTLGRAPGEE